MSMANLGVYITLIAAILAAYLTYRNQLRLKAFELLLARRQAVLSDIEKQLHKLNEIVKEFDTADNGPLLRAYLKEFFHDAVILYHKTLSSNFGGSAATMIQSYWEVSQEPYDINRTTKFDVKSWVNRTTNVLAALYAFANAEMNREIETLTLSVFAKVTRRFNQWRASRKSNSKPPPNRSLKVTEPRDDKNSPIEHSENSGAESSVR